MISPLLFNIYLEEALLSLPTWNQSIQNDLVRVYAEDLLVACDELSTVTKLIKELEEVDASYRIILNKKKSVILNKPSQKYTHRLTAVGEVPVVLNTTYLGTGLDVCLDA